MKRPRHPLLDELPAETLERFAIYEALLLKWQRTINLVSPSTLPEIWTRHFADSLQVCAAAPAARRWLDLGSGAGFPGLVTAIRLAGERGAKVHLIESDQRKCAFLRAVSRETDAGAIVHCGRIEAVVPQLAVDIEAVSARALAPLPQLVAYAEPFLRKGAIGVFSKGANAQLELTQVEAAGTYQLRSAPSLTRDMAQIVVVERRDARAVPTSAPPEPSF